MEDSWFADRARWDSGCSLIFFAQDIPELKAGGSKKILPCLRKLSLAAVSSETMTPELIIAFNIGALKSLKLWNCLGSSELPERLDKSRQAIRLMSFEFTDDNMDYIDFETEPIIEFLEHFQGP